MRDLAAAINDSEMCYLARRKRTKLQGLRYLQFCIGLVRDIDERLAVGVGVLLPDGLAPV